MKSAEGAGFEPAKGFSTLRGFQVPRLRPLGHPSKERVYIRLEPGTMEA